MALSFRISVEFPRQLATIDPMAAILPSVARAVEQVAIAGQARWQEAVHAVPGLWIGERQAYEASIKLRQVSVYEWEIYSDYKYVEDIESGRPPYDMKRMLDTSLKVRVNKQGRRYLIIPMRHNTPGNTAHAPAMPPEIHAEAKQLSKSRIVGRGSRLSGTGAWDTRSHLPARVRSRKYVWGGRLPEGLAPKLRASHATDPYAGMVRMKVATGGSQYMTFRTMVEGSPKWIIPARPGLWIARAVAESLQRTANKDIGAAIAADLS